MITAFGLAGEDYMHSGGKLWHGRRWVVVRVTSPAQ